MARHRIKNKHLPERVYIKNGAYYYVSKKTNEWIKLARVPHVSVAVKKYYELRGFDRPLIRMNDLFDKYMAEIAPQKKPNTFKGNLRQIAPLRDAFGSMKPDDVTPPHIYQYLKKRAEKGAPVLGNREKALLSHIFSIAIEQWGVAKFNPCKGVKRNKEKPRDRYIEDWEMDAVYNCKHATPLIKCMMRFAYISTLRESDILKIGRADIYDDGIYTKAGKTEKKMLVEMSPHLKETIEQIKMIPRNISGLSLFCNHKGQPYTSDGFRTFWQRFMTNVLKDKILTTRFTFHDIRAKGLSDIEQGHAYELGGHSDSRVTERVYRRKIKRVKPVL